MNNLPSPTQYCIESESTFHTPKSVLEYYNVSERDLDTIYRAFEGQCKKYLIEVLTVNLTWMKEENEWEDADHSETCTSDGKTIYLHNQLSDHWGIMTRVYDIMHMWCGHLIQRWAKENSGLEYYGDKARKIGSVFHMWASDDLLLKVSNYELEAGILWVQHLREIIKEVILQDSDTESIIQLYSDYVQTDHEYIIDYYRTGKSSNFFKNRKFNQELLPEINLPIVIDIQKRSDIEIWLVRKDG